MGFIAEYKKSLKLVDVEEVFDLIFYRPLAFLFVKSILKTNLTPNQITLSAVFLGVIGALCVAYGKTETIFAASFLLMIYNILDCADGMLARIKKNGTELGRIIDGIGDYVVSTAVYFAIGFGFASNSSDPTFFWILTVATGFSNAFQASLVDYNRNRYLDYAFDRNSLLEDSTAESAEAYKKLKQQKGKYFDKFVYWIYIGYSNIQLKFSSGNKDEIKKKYDKNDFLKKNRVMIHLWTYLGPTTQWTLFIAAAFINRFDLYFYTLTFVFNAVAIIFIVTQSLINKKVKIAEAS